MARGTAALIVGLAIITLAIIALAALVLVLFGLSQEGTEGLGLAEALWIGFMHAMDAGALGADSGWGFRIVMLVVTLGGIFVMSTLIGVLSAGLESKLDDLRRGRSAVVERGHSTILGWNGQIFPIIEQLIIANENQKKSTIVILSSLDKTQMEEELSERVPKRGRTKIVVRSGCPSLPDDLSILNLGDSKSIIILSNEGPDSDAEVVKTTLAVMKDRARNGGEAPIVAEIQKPQNIEPALIAAAGRITLVRVGELVSRIIAQSCRQNGLSRVYLELLDFDGDEIYFTENPKLIGMSYFEIMTRFADSSLIGILNAEAKAELNPSMDRVLQDGEKLIVIAADDDLAHPLERSLKSAYGQAKAGIAKASAENTVERTLIVGWNWKVPMIIAELDGYTVPGSSVTVACESDTALSQLQALKKSVKNQEMRLLKGNCTDRRFLDGLRLESYDRIVVMSDEGGLSIEDADAKSIISLLHIRDIARRNKIKFGIVSEILDIRNRELAEAAEADDFIVSDRILSMMLAMLSENPMLESVLEILFNSEGSEIYLKPASLYLKLGVKADFLAVVEAAAARGETAIGFSIARHSQDPDLGYGIRVNPPKAMELELQSEDRIIVLAQD